KRTIGPSRLRKAHMSIQLRSYTAAQSWDQTVASVPKRFWKTQSYGRMQKLLPKRGWRLVLSAPEKRSAASIAISTSDLLEPTSLSDERGSISHDWMSPR